MAEYDKDKSIRAAAVSNKYNVTTFVYRADGNYSNIKVSLTGHPISSKYTEKKGETETDDTITIWFNITAYPSMNSTVNITDLNKVDDIVEVMDSDNETKSKPTDDDFYKIISFPEDMKHPKILSHANDKVHNNVDIPQSFNESVLPEDIQEKLQKLQLKLKNDIITRTGYNKTKIKLLMPFVSIIGDKSKKTSHGEVTERLPDELKSSVANDAKKIGGLRKEVPDVTEDLSVAGHQHKKGDPGKAEKAKGDHDRRERQR